VEGGKNWLNFGNDPDSFVDSGLHLVYSLPLEISVLLYS